MEDKEDLLKKKLMEEDPEFRTLMEEHVRFEKILDEFNERSHLTPSEETERKKIQKLKLSGKDKMEIILAKYRGK
jgi:uncharacterized protein YdcH (DUF465 family)